MRRRGRNILLPGSLMVMIVMLTACSIAKKQGRPVSTVAPVREVSTVTGIVTENDTSGGQITLRDLDSETVNTLYYNDTSVIQDEYEKEREGEKIGIGEILEISYLPQEGLITDAVVPKDVWSYEEVQEFAFDADQNMLTIIDEKKQYSTLTFCSSGEELMEPMDFDSQDSLTIRGIGIHVYSIVRAKGHGYIRLINYDDFIGGMAEVDNDIMVPIKENMLITVAEGNYRLTLLKNRMAAAKTVVVTTDQEVIVDFSDYKKEVKDIGEVTFYIQPEGAELTLNGTSVDYSAPVTLNYGKYKVRVTLAGYEDYIGILNVEQSSKPIHIVLEEADSAISVATPTPSSDSSSSTSSDTVTKTIDKKHTITVTAPEGVEVFLDNVYKGLAPCSFTKVIGSHTITLSDTGYVTKSYPVDILDDDKNAKFSFSELEKEASSTSSPEE